MNTISRRLAGVTAAAAITLSGVALSAGSANAAPITQSGLVNVAADDVNVQIPIAAAANICGVAVNVLATAANFGDVDCTAEGVALANNDNGGSGPVRQQGLVNVALTDVNVQVPVTVAANVCGVAVGVLTQAANLGDVTCDTSGVSLAEVI
jgi:hypothetical protein